MRLAYGRVPPCAWACFAGPGVEPIGVSFSFRRVGSVSSLRSSSVCSVPPFLGVFMFIREPEMMNDMLSDPMGRAMLAAALVLEIIGIFVFRKFIKVHI